MKLSDLKVNESAVVNFIDDNLAERNRLLKLGLTSGIKITLVRFSLFNSPVEIKFRDYYLAIRKEVADKITVNKID